MGFEGFSSSKWPGMARRNRSKSFPDSRGPEVDKIGQSPESAYGQMSDMGRLNGCTNSKKKQLSHAEIRNSLRQEILQLEKILQDQVSIRCALEQALGFRASSLDITNETTIPKPTTELIKEIAVLELEVGLLEQYLLSLYRKAIGQQISSLSPSQRDEVLPLATPRKRHLDFSRPDITIVREEFAPEVEPLTLSDSRKEASGLSEEKLVQRSHSSLSQHLTLANISSPPEYVLGKPVRTCHSQPLSKMEYAQDASLHVVSLAEHLGTSISDHIPDTPNKLSQDMVKSMCDIYCRLADPPLSYHGLSSPTSSLSSMSAFSPKDKCNLWRPGLRNDTFDVRLDNPFHVEGLKDFSGPGSMVEVNCLCKDRQKLSDIEYLLQNFRSLISSLLEEIDPRKMTHEEKLVFWVNVHNALVMHAFLAYGIPQNNVKRMPLLLKAAYNVGGHVVSAEVMQNSILGCRISRPGQGLRFLLSKKQNLKLVNIKHMRLNARCPFSTLHFHVGAIQILRFEFTRPRQYFKSWKQPKKDYIRAKDFWCSKGSENPFAKDF